MTGIHPDFWRSNDPDSPGYYGEDGDWDCSSCARPQQARRPERVTRDILAPQVVGGWHPAYRLYDGL